jgi:hypothetical protein
MEAALRLAGLAFAVLGQARSRLAACAESKAVQVVQGRWLQWTISFLSSVALSKRYDYLDVPRPSEIDEAAGG